ncbi:hypothetical protein Scep_010217 [Stephania cephalantha]|uniref:Uncharacterized protein n=1 Tax=Stephania cephalantha TaxID=152367 RepID=A0AAP0JV15_9MAGN
MYTVYHSSLISSKCVLSQSPKLTQTCVLFASQLPIYVAARHWTITPNKRHTSALHTPSGPRVEPSRIHSVTNQQQPIRLSNSSFILEVRLAPSPSFSHDVSDSSLPQTPATWRALIHPGRHQQFSQPTRTRHVSNLHYIYQSTVDTCPNPCIERPTTTRCSSTHESRNQSPKLVSFTSLDQF